MKYALISIFTIVLTFSSYAADDWATSEGSCYSKGDFNLSFGLSAGWVGFFAIGEYNVHDAISVGGATGYNGYSYSTWWRYNYIPIVGRATFHPFNLKILSDKIDVRDIIDPYAGMATGWNIGWATERKDLLSNMNNNVDVGHFVFRELIGIKFYPGGTENFYLTAEEGGGLSIINLGVGLRF